MPHFPEEREANISARERIANRVSRDILLAIEATSVEFDPLLRPGVVDSADGFHFVSRLPWETFRTDIVEALAEGYEEALREGWVIGIEFAPFGEQPDLEDPADDPALVAWLFAEAREKAGIIIENSQKALEHEFNRFRALGLEPGEMSDRLAPMVGLTLPEARSIDNNRLFLIAAGLLTAREIIRAGRQRRDRLRAQRALRIAQSEAQTGIQRGELAVVTQMIREGRIPETVVKTWITVLDERVCPVCRPLHGIQAKLNDAFFSIRGIIESPPAHPLCRCFMEFSGV